MNIDKTYDMNKKPHHFAFFSSVIKRYMTLNDQTIHQFYELFCLRKFKKNDKIIAIGQVETFFNILYSGYVVSCTIDANGKFYHKNIFSEGDFLTSTVSALTNHKSTFELEAITDIILLSCDYKKFKELIKENEAMKDFYIAYLEKNWVIDKEKREVDIILKNSKERYLEFISQFPNIENDVPLKYIASHLGITATQLSRIRSGKL